MHDSEKEIALTRVKKRSSWQTTRDTSDDAETVNQFTMFVIGAAAFFAGFWALACLGKAFFHDGPWSMLRHLTTAITG